MRMSLPNIEVEDSGLFAEFTSLILRRQDTYCIHDVLTVCFDNDLLIAPYHCNEKLGQTDLQCRIKVQFWLLNNRSAPPLSKKSPKEDR